MMKQNILNGFLSTLLLLIVVGCSEHVENKDTPRFQLLSSSKTTVNFNNLLNENDSVNYFTYPYIYMGGGVGIGDINNDGLPDLYFTGNMVENKLYLNKGNMKFEDITQQAGLQGDSRWYTGPTMVDINADGFLDIYLCVSGKSGNKRNQLFLNNGDLTFTDVSDSYGIDDAGQSIQSAFFDYDKDGDLDLYVVNYPMTHFKTSNEAYRHNMDNLVEAKSDHLYRNDGEGKFTDVTVESGILNFGLSISGSVADYNNDGWDDIYVSNDFSTPDYLYINNGDGTFTDRTKETTKQTSFYGMGTDAADYNNDGLIDLIQVDMAAEINRRVKANMASMNPNLFWSTVNNGFHYQYMYNSLQLNRGIDENGLPVFSNVAWMAGVSSTDWSWAPVMADFDNDGWKDLFISNGIRREINNKDFFKKAEKKVTKSTPLDTLLAITNKIPSEAIDNYIFKNKGDLTFEKINEVWGLKFEGFSNGASYGDLDNDGDLDLVINNIDSESAIFENLTSNKKDGNYLVVKFQDEGKNRLGIGNKVTVITNDGKQLQHLNPNRGFQSYIEPVLHFGIGKTTEIDSLIIEWTDGTKKLLTKVEANQIITLGKGDGKLFTPKSSNIEPLYIANNQAFDSIFTHSENYYNDYAKQVLLPHKMSNFGPGIAVGDVNGDELDDIFVGNGATYRGALYLQDEDGKFSIQGGVWDDDSIYEDMDAELIDLDNDGDKDLYVVSGGAEFDPEFDFNYQDRIYLNDNGTFTKADNVLPNVHYSGSRVIPNDIDNDGDIDLFVGGRLNSGEYPTPGTSFILINKLVETGKLQFEDQTDELAPGLANVGMVTDAIWIDFDENGTTDLVTVGEWMPITIFSQENGKFVDATKTFDLDQSHGWWYSIDKGDFDNDGDLDLVVGNLGLNYKYQASDDASFDVYYYDFDQNGSNDIVLGYYNFGEQYPVRGRQCSSQQIKAIQFKFDDYESFSTASIEDVYGTADLEKALHYKINSFASIYLENKGNGKYERTPLPNLAQVSPINDMVIDDFDNDGNLDVLVGGNLHASEVETPRADAGIGILLMGNGKGDFMETSFNESGFNMGFDLKNLTTIKVGGKKGILATNNQGPLQLFTSYKSTSDKLAVK